MTTTLSGLVRECAGLLRAGNIENERFEAEQMVQKCCGADVRDLIMYPEREVAPEQETLVRECVSRRLSGEPLQYILGEWEFCGLLFYVGDGVLIPRQDTETLAELALEYIRGRRQERLLAADLCAGSGCIGISLAVLGGADVTLVELSDRAAEYLRRNIAHHGADGRCTVVQADVLSEDTAGRLPTFDLIVTNPPYLTGQDMEQLQREVTYEPEMALYGGEDGLDFYRRMLPLWSERLNPGGMFAAEIGMGQEKDVMQIFEECGLAAHYCRDMCGVIRVIYGIKNGGK